jgi:hypothetical protein
LDNRSAAGGKHARGKPTSARTPYIAPNGDEWIDSEELARRIRRSKRWVEDRTRSGEIPADRRGRQPVYLWNSGDPNNLVTEWLKRRRKDSDE